MCAGEEGKHVVDPLQRPAAQLERGDRVRKCRRRRLGGNGRDLGRVLGERPCESRQEVLGPNAGNGGTPAKAVQSSKSGLSPGAIVGPAELFPRRAGASIWGIGRGLSKCGCRHDIGTGRRTSRDRRS